MASTNQEYDVNDELAQFFQKTSVTRDACDRVAGELVGGHVIPVAVQGACSYTVYGGRDHEFVVQFRLKSLELRTATAELVRRIYGAFAPEVSFAHQLGQDATCASNDADGLKEPLLVYIMSRMGGISHLNFMLADAFPTNSPENFVRRDNLIRDMARFLAASWKQPQSVSEMFKVQLGETYKKELQLLLVSLPDRFRPVVQATLDSLPDILALPMVLVHKDLGDCNIMVHQESCHLVGVIDWAEAEIAPFGTNLHSLQGLMSMLHLKKGWIRYDDYDTLVAAFWETFPQTADGDGDRVTSDKIRAIKAARTLGLFRSRGFTSRLANIPEPVPIRDDDSGRYNLMILDGLLLDPATRLDGVE